MEELAFQQATQTYLWAMPLINTLGMKFGSEKVFGAGYNILPVWKERLDPKTLVTTPNSDVLYAMGYVDKPRYMRWRRYRRFEQLVWRLEAAGWTAMSFHVGGMKRRMR